MNLAPKQMKTVTKFISKPLTLLCNISMTTGVFPRELKVADIIPLFKSGTTLCVNNYRPISILPVFSTVYEKIMFYGLSEYLKMQNIVCSNQFGFREKHSSYMALITVVDRLSEALGNGGTVIGLFRDFSKAFDTVDHEILLCKLEHYGIRCCLLDWFKDYLYNRCQFVTYYNTSSQHTSVKCGVPQGSILGSLFFFIYINDLPHATTLFSVLFADDTNMFDCNKDINGLIAHINTEIGKACDWLYANKVSMNVSKTHFMVWSPRKAKLEDLGPITLNGQEIDRVLFLMKVYPGNRTFIMCAIKSVKTQAF